MEDEKKSVPYLQGPLKCKQLAIAANQCGLNHCWPVAVDLFLFQAIGDELDILLSQ